MIATTVSTAAPGGSCLVTWSLVAPCLFTGPTTKHSRSAVRSTFSPTLAGGAPERWCGKAVALRRRMVAKLRPAYGLPSKCLVMRHQWTFIADYAIHGIALNPPNIFYESFFSANV